MSPLHASLTLRSAGDSDAPALERLAALDGRKVPAGEVLVAASGDEIVAAYGVQRGERIGDPFRPTADVLDLLELHASRRQPGGGRARAGRRRPALRFRIA